ncbi:MAG: error-prone DNA polymerase [Anaerolineae bacterium]
MYAELHCHSYFSLLDGASSPEALVKRAAELELPALALTDHDALYGAVAFWRAAEEAGIKAVLGAEVTVGESLPHPSPLPGGEGGSVPLSPAGRGARGEGRDVAQRESFPHPSPLPGGEGGRSPVPLSPAGRGARGEGPRVTHHESSPHPGPLPGREGVSVPLTPAGRGARGEGRTLHHLTLLAEDNIGYANLSQLISTARLRSPKGQALATWDDLTQHSAGLIALSGGRQGLVAQHLLAGDKSQALRTAQDLQALFGPDRFFVELQRQLRPGDERLVQDLLRLAQRIGAPVVVTNNVHYAQRAGHRLHDVLTAIRSHATLDASYVQRRGNSEAHLKGAAEMAKLFADQPDALRRTLEIAQRCQVSLRRGVQDLPLFPTGSASQHDFLATLCRQALIEHTGAEPGERAQRLLTHELAVIGQLGLANYFLIVWDIVRFARSQGIRCQGRGSAANSLIAFLLGITPIDPLAHDLVFERFLSTERPTTPDIDIDFQAERREEVIQYIYDRYGRKHAAMACTFVTYRQRSAVRDVARVLDFPPDLVDALANAADRRSLEEAWREISSSFIVPPSSFSPVDRRTWQLLLHLCEEIQRLPRHLGIHNGGFVLSRQPLAEIIPLEPATMPGRTVVQWDKEALEDAGMVKIDVLGLRMLGAVEEAVGWVEGDKVTRRQGDKVIGNHSGGTGRLVDWEIGAPQGRVGWEGFDDAAVYGMISAGDTVGVFQVESRAQAQLLPRLRPQNFADLVVEISLIRPGPVQAGMVHPYLRRRLGQEPVSYLHPALEPALRDTLGVIVFQEQVLKVAQALAGWSGGQGELLRRALGRKDNQEALARLRQTFVADAAALDVSPATAAQIFSQLEAFGSYSFAKSHAAAFAVIVYQSAWLKRYHPIPFYVALLNHQPMGFWSPAVLLNDARRHGIAVLPASVNESAAGYVPEGRGVRIGLATVQGLGQSGAERIVAARAGQPFASLLDFCRRTRLARRLVENLIVAGALDGLQERERGREGEGGRRGMLWQLGLLDYEETTLLGGQEPEAAPLELPPLAPLEAMAGELQMMGVSAGPHVMTHHRAAMQQAGVLSSRDLVRCHEGAVVWVAGQVTVVQSPPTAKGFMFVTLEDEFGMVNVVVAPDVVARYRRVWRRTPLLAVQGSVQRQGPLVNLLALRPWPLRASQQAADS